MRIKLDENLGLRAKEVLSAKGHDVQGIRDEGLSGSPDPLVFEVARQEQRVLVTLDHDFGNLLRFPTEKSSGVVILETPEPVNYLFLLNQLEVLSDLLLEREVRGKLWILQPGRLREKSSRSLDLDELNEST